MVLVNSSQSAWSERISGNSTANASGKGSGDGEGGGIYNYVYGDTNFASITNGSYPTGIFATQINPDGKSIDLVYNEMNLSSVGASGTVIGKITLSGSNGNYTPTPESGGNVTLGSNDIAGLHLTEAHVLAAIGNAATGPVAEGNVGGGTGMIAYEFKGGTGTASRLVTTRLGQYTLGVLVQANHGLRPWLRVCGVPVGDAMPQPAPWSGERGSIIAIAATDAPLMPLQLQRIARRIAIGMGRGGTPSGNNSGDIYMAFSTANDPGEVPEPQSLHFEALSNDDLDTLFLATVESVDEAILNAMLAAETMIGKAGRVVHAIDPEQLLQLVGAEKKAAAADCT